MSNTDTLLKNALSEYTPEIAALGEALISKARRRLPGANMLIYDNYNALVAAFSANDKQGGIVLSVTLYPRWVSLFFPKGASLHDPEGLLKGSGKSIRHVVIKEQEQFDQGPVNDLIEQAISSADPQVPEGVPGYVIVKSVASKKRSRRP